MKQYTILKLDSVEVLQSETGIISFITDNETDAMMDLTARIFTLETTINELLLDQLIIDEPESIVKKLADRLKAFKPEVATVPTDQ